MQNLSVFRNAQLFSCSPEGQLVPEMGASASWTALRPYSTISPAAGWGGTSPSPSRAAFTLKRTWSTVAQPTRLVAISPCLTASMMASLAMSQLWDFAAATAPRAACLTLSGAGCQSGGPLSVSRPMDSTEPLMTASPFSCRYGTNSSSVLSFSAQWQYDSTASTAPGSTLSRTVRKAFRGRPVMPMWRTSPCFFSSTKAGSVSFTI
mmetsp:Transcript_3898/g.11308  ORF Transcript_3898/g.11308 Transcript_3898/m.11308 type:complete len:207 (-) Transcript_3898:630-1250(-)